MQHAAERDWQATMMKVQVGRRGAGLAIDKPGRQSMRLPLSLQEDRSTLRPVQRSDGFTLECLGTVVGGVDAEDRRLGETLVRFVAAQPSERCTPGPQLVRGSP